MKVHEGMTDKGGHPYILHPLKVAEGVEGDELKIVALLHDVLEDSDMTEQELRREGFPENVVEAVSVLTHRDEDGDYFTYIENVKKNPMATAVKISDLQHNLDLSRIAEPTAADYRRCEKYRRSLAYLQGETDHI